MQLPIALEQTTVGTTPVSGDGAAVAGRIGRFALLRQIGAGAMGVVFAAYDEELDRRVAIKLMRASEGGSEGRARMLREAQAMARLSHPHVVQVYEAGVHAQQVFVAMEFIDGETLAAWQRAARRSAAELIAMYVQAGEGLAAAHAAGLVHRDFKPDNVLVGNDGRVRVGDFGLARAQGSGDGPPRDAGGPVDATALLAATIVSEDRANLLASPMTLAGAVVGTPAYMSPEQLRGAPVDARSDQFSFCAALYEALYGQRPFAGDTLLELSEHVQAGELRSPPPGHAVPQWLWPLLQRGLATNPAWRFADMKALLAELGRDVHRDPRQGARERRRLAVLIAVTITGVSAMILRSYLTSGQPIVDTFDFVRTAVVTLVALVVGVALFGRSLLTNHYHRAVLTLSVLLALQMLLVRLTLVLAGASILTLIRVDFITVAAMFALGGLLIARWMAWIASLPVVGAVVSLFAAEQAPFIAQFVYPGFVVAYLIGWGRSSRRPT